MQTAKENVYAQAGVLHLMKAEIRRLQKLSDTGLIAAAKHESGAIQPGDVDDLRTELGLLESAIVRAFKIPDLEETEDGAGRPFPPSSGMAD